MSARVDFAFIRAVRSPTGPRSRDARLVAVEIALRCDDGQGHLSREEIGDAWLLGAGAVRLAIRELKAGGWLKEQPRPGKPRWTIMIPEGRPDALAAAKVLRHRKPSKGVIRSKASRCDPLEGFPPDRIRSARRLGSDPLEGLDPIRSKATPPRSTPKNTPRETPSDLTREEGIIAKTIPELPKAPPIAPGTQVALPGLEAPKAKPTDPLQAPEVTEVLEHWRSRGYHTRPVGDLPAYRKRVRDRLDEAIAGGIPVAVAAETLKAAIDGASIDDWLMGRHERNNTATGGKVYKGIETILRDAAQVEKLATLWDVALAEGRAHPDGGDRHYDRFGNPRSGKRFQYPVESGGEPIGAEETDRRFAAMAAESEAREQRVRDEEARIEAERRAALAPEIRAEEDMLRAVVERSRARMAEAEAREMN